MMMTFIPLSWKIFFLSFFFLSRPENKKENREIRRQVKAVKGRLDRLLKNFNYFLPRTDDCLKKKKKNKGKNWKTWYVGTTQWSMVLNIFSNVVYCLFCPLTFANLFPIRFFLTDSLRRHRLIKQDSLFFSSSSSGCIREMRF